MRKLLAHALVFAALLGLGFFGALVLGMMWSTKGVPFPLWAVLRTLELGPNVPEAKRLLAVVYGYALLTSFLPVVLLRRFPIPGISLRASSLAAASAGLSVAMLAQLCSVFGLSDVLLWTSVTVIMAGSIGWTLDQPVPFDGSVRRGRWGGETNV